MTQNLNLSDIILHDSEVLTSDLDQITNVNNNEMCFGVTIKLVINNFG